MAYKKFKWIRYRLCFSYYKSSQPHYPLNILFNFLSYNVILFTEIAICIVCLNADHTSLRIYDANLLKLFSMENVFTILDTTSIDAQLGNINTFCLYFF